MEDIKVFVHVQPGPRARCSPAEAAGRIRELLAAVRGPRVVCFPAGARPAEPHGLLQRLPTPCIALR